MNTRSRIFAGLLAVAFLASQVYLGSRIGRLERQIERLEAASPTRSLVEGPVHVYDDEFVRYFGERGVREVERARAILSEQILPARVRVVPAP